MQTSSNSRSSIWRSTPATRSPRAARCALMSTTDGSIARSCRSLHRATMWSCRSATTGPAWTTRRSRKHSTLFSRRKRRAVAPGSDYRWCRALRRSREALPASAARWARGQPLSCGCRKPARRPPTDVLIGLHRKSIAARPMCCSAMMMMM